jgi:hypothetical protein
MKLRIALIVLVLANVLFFGWSQLEGKPATRGATPVADGTLDLAAAGTRPRTQCRRFGPFSDEASASAAQAALGMRGLQTRLQQHEAVRPTSWAVRLIGLDSRAARDAAVLQLRRAGVRDTAIIVSTSGDTQLFAGVFREAAGVKHRVAQIQRAGFQTQVDELLQTVQERWISTELSVQAVAPTAAELGIAPSAATAAGATTPAWDSC